MIGDPALARLAAAPALFVGMDYDGTLAGIVSHPSQATLVDGAQVALARLAARFASGRFRITRRGG